MQTHYNNLLKDRICYKKFNKFSINWIINLKDKTSHNKVKKFRQTQNINHTSHSTKVNKVIITKNINLKDSVGCKKEHRLLLFLKLKLLNTLGDVHCVSVNTKI